MKTVTLEEFSTDKIIKQIDNELLILDKVSQTKSEYQIFDFYEALKRLNKAILADTTNRKEYFKLQIEQYRNVFYDLFFTECKVIFIEFLNYDPDKRLLKQKETICLSPAYSREEHICETIIKDEERHNNWIRIDRKGVNKKEPLVIRSNKYNYLLEGCAPSIKTTVQLADYIRKTTQIEFLISDFNKLFPPVLNENILSDLTFEGYIKSLKFGIVADSADTDKPELNFADYLKHPDPDKHLSDIQKNELMLKIKNEFPKGKDTEAAIMIFALTVCELFPESINQTDVIKAIKNEWKTEFDEAFRKKLRELNKIKASKETRQKEEYKGDVISAISKIRSMCQQMKL